MVIEKSIVRRYVILSVLASTLPVQWLLPSVGWRGLFWVVAGLLLLPYAAFVAWAGTRAGVPRNAVRAVVAMSTETPAPAPA